ncbi:hypothetical protein B0H14DRAFT_3483051 [Mycena olivaceomarginata]|nr:hypothetical protein B0H14DRAFT_3483051 [Mycena olivaceomarginata]
MPGCPNTRYVSAPLLKKRKKISAGNTDSKPPAKEKHKKASAEEDDGAHPAKRKKTSPRENEPAAPAVAKLRPKPRRLAKKAVGPTAPARSVSPTPRSPAVSTSAASPKRTEAASAAARPMVKGKRGGPPGQRPQLYSILSPMAYRLHTQILS